MRRRTAPGRRAGGTARTGRPGWIGWIGWIGREHFLSRPLREREPDHEFLRPGPGGDEHDHHDHHDHHARG